MEERKCMFLWFEESCFIWLTYREKQRLERDGIVLQLVDEED